MKKTKKVLQQGFTIVELMMYAALLSGLLVVLSNLFISSLDVQSSNRIRSSIDQEGKFALNRLQYDVLRASNVTTPANLGDTSDTLVLTIGGQNYTYQVSSNSLQLDSPAGLSAVTNSDVVVSNFSVTRTGNAGGKNLLQISVEIDTVFTNTSDRFEKTFTTVAGLR